MKLPGFDLPKSLVAGVRRGRFRRERGSWALRSDHDSFGNVLETELGEVFETAEQLASESAGLSTYFSSDGDYGSSSPELAGPGAVPDIVDFSRIICFATSGDGAPFCLDYRESGSIPRVLWWDDCYWRVVSPDFDAFLALFDFPEAT